MIAPDPSNVTVPVTSPLKVSVLAVDHLLADTAVVAVDAFPSNAPTKVSAWTEALLVPPSTSKWNRLAESSNLI